MSNELKDIEEAIRKGQEDIAATIARLFALLKEVMPAGPASGFVANPKEE